MKKNYFLLLIGILFFSLSCFAQQASALNLDGVDDEIICGDHPSVQITGTAITLEARIKVDAFDPAGFFADNIINKLGENVNGYAIRVGGPGVMSFVLGNGVEWTDLLTPDNTLSPDTWYHVAATYDGAMMRIYVDGNEIANQVATVSITNTPSPLRLGESGFPGRHIDGTLDEARVWNIVRTPVELMDNMNTELSLPQTGLVAYYKFNQGVAGGDNSTETELIDELGNSNGTLTNFSLDGDASNWVDGGILILNTESFNLSAFSVIPSPAQSDIRIEGLTNPTDYLIYNTLGQIVLKGNVIENNIDVTSLKQGVYIISLDSLGSVRFIKE